MARRSSPNARTRKPAPVVHPPFFGCTVEETAALIYLSSAFGPLTHILPDAFDQRYFVPPEAKFHRCPECESYLPSWPRCRFCGWREPGARWIFG